MTKKKLIILGIVLFLISTVASFYAFSKSGAANGLQSATSNPTPGKSNNDYQGLSFDGGAKTEECPLNGAKYSSSQKAWWEKHRPLGVMIENHLDARPQSGISFSDVTYEAVAEGGITRTLNVYYCQDGGIVGPVRSARTYFLDFISEYADYPLYAHVGGANTSGPADALGQIDGFGWGGYNDLNQFSIGFPTYWRDQTRQGHDVATEHTMYSTTTKLWDIGVTRKLTNVDKDGKSWNANFVKYTFKDDANMSERPSNQTVHLDFWQDPNYAVDWTYSKTDNIYLRKNGGAPHIDRNTHKQLSTKNLVILFMTERHANDGYEGNAHMLYGTKGSGTAYMIMDGKQVIGRWKKASRTDRTMLYDNIGNEVKFNRGKIWFEIIATDGTVTVK